MAAGPGRTDLRCDEIYWPKEPRSNDVEAARRAAKQLNLIAAGNWIRREVASLWPVFRSFRRILVSL